MIQDTIRRKTHNLTRNHSRNDPIDHRIKSFSFRNFKDKIRHSRGNLCLVLWQNLDFKDSLDAEIDLKEEETKRVKYWDV